MIAVSRDAHQDCCTNDRDTECAQETYECDPNVKLMIFGVDTHRITVLADPAKLELRRKSPYLLAGYPVKMGHVHPVSAVIHPPAVRHTHSGGVAFAKVITVGVAVGGKLIDPDDAFRVLVGQCGRSRFSTGWAGALASHS